MIKVEQYATSMTHKYVISDADAATQCFDFISQVIEYNLLHNEADPKLLSKLLIAKAESMVGR